jgi:hypothetical protein
MGPILTPPAPHTKSLLKKCAPPAPHTKSILLHVGLGQQGGAHISIIVLYVWRGGRGPYFKTYSVCGAGREGGGQISIIILYGGRERERATPQRKDRTYIYIYKHDLEEGIPALCFLPMVATQVSWAYCQCSCSLMRKRQMYHSATG